MPDPITIVSLVTNALQLVEYGLRFCREAQAIYKTGLSGSNQDVQTTTGLFIEATELLITNLKDFAPGRKLNVCETTILRLAEESTSIGKQLQLKLEALRLNGARGKLKSIRQAVKSIWNRREIRETVKRLGVYRTQLPYHLQLYSEQRREEANKLDHDDRKKWELKSELCKADDLFKRLLEQNAVLLSTTRKSHEDVMGVLNRIETKIDGLAWTPHDPEQQLLSYLHFEQISSRFYSIADAHRSTLNWLFGTPSCTENTRTSLSEWLESGKGVFFVNGKAGSGKSVLLKRICTSRKALDAALLWSEDQYLLTGSFFAWHSGIGNQNTAIGLYRSLLYQLLKGRPDLIKIVLPDHYKMAQEMRPLREQPAPEIYAHALEVLADLTSKRSTLSFAPPRICIFIDGLDEFEDDQGMLATFLQGLAERNDGFKILISGRPSNTFDRIFENCPQIHVQDLTSWDVRSFTEKALAADPRWNAAFCDRPDRTRTLVNRICKKANGVFLWVSLVMKALLDAFHDGDSFSELEDTLNKLPAELEALYQHMFKNMRPHHRKQAAQYFKMVQEFHLTWPTQPPTLLFLCTASSSAAESIYSQCKLVEKRIKARCCGLLEVQPRKGIGLEVDALVNAEIYYIHESAAEFLSLERNRQFIAEHTEELALDLELRLCQSHLLQLRWDVEFVRFERKNAHTVESLVCQLRRDPRLQTADRPPIVEQLVHIIKYAQSRETLPYHAFPTTDTSLCFAVRAGLVEYVRWRLSDEGRAIDPVPALPDMYNILRDLPYGISRPPLQAVNEMLKLVLPHGARAPQKDLNFASWAHVTDEKTWSDLEILLDHHKLRLERPWLLDQRSPLCLKRSSRLEKEAVGVIEAPVRVVIPVLATIKIEEDWQELDLIDVEASKQLSVDDLKHVLRGKRRPFTIPSIAQVGHVTSRVLLGIPTVACLIPVFLACLTLELADEILGDHTHIRKIASWRRRRKMRRARARRKLERRYAVKDFREDATA